MAQPVKDNKILLFEEESRTKLLEGAKSSYDTVMTTYGAKGKNVLIEKPYGRAVLTRDGVTVAKEVYFKDRTKNMGAQLVLEASQTTNRTVGDGTSATVGLTYHLLKQALQQIAAGKNPMEIRDQLSEDCQLLLKELDKYTQPISKGQLEQVATVSSGDPALGKLIAEAVEHVGLDGGIITEKAYISGVEREYIEGYYLQEGFQALTEGRRELENPIVVISAKKISSNADFLELMDKVVKITQENKPRIAFIGEFEGQAADSIVANLLKGTMDAVVVKTPSSGNMGVQYLEDIAIYCGCRMISAGDSLKSFDQTYIGHADKVISTPYTTSIFGGKHVDESLNERLTELNERIETEESDALTEKFRDRLAKLQGKIAVFRIGGANDTEKEEKEFRIDDAIQSTRAAMESGVVAGGGVTLLWLSQTKGLSQAFKNALQGVFRRLLENASLSAEVKMNEMLKSEYPMGVNLRGDDELVDLMQAGILDPALVLQEVIRNASSIAGNMATVGASIIFEDGEDKK